MLVGTDRVPMALRQAVHRVRPHSLAITYCTGQSGPMTSLPAAELLDQPDSVGRLLEGVQLQFLGEFEADCAPEIQVDKRLLLAYPDLSGGWTLREQHRLGFRPGDRLRPLG